MSFYEYTPYVSVAQRREKADRKIRQMKKKDKDLSPVLIEGRTMAKNWWGKAWNRNLEGYADYSNRISRGKSYVSNHAVLDLRISRGCVKAQVLGSASTPYQVEIKIDELKEKQWKRVVTLCNNRFESLEQLAEGKFPRELEELFTDKSGGLFPSPGEIHFDCSCPDYAYMCKHVAAALYGVGVRLDQDPLLFFELRGVDVEELLKKTVEDRLEHMLVHAQKGSGRVIGEERMHELFGI